MIIVLLFHSCAQLTPGHLYLVAHAMAYGDRCFAAAGPTLWDSPPLHLRKPDISSNRFKTLSKTFLFKLTGIAAICE